jgi:hypothetical protein
MNVLNIVLVIFEIIIILSAIVGNVFIIFMFIRDKKLRNGRNYNLVSLALVDFIFAFFGIPLGTLVSFSQ